MKNIVYQIRNIITNKLYIGSTVDFKNRVRNHLWLLRKNNHHSDYLQRSYNKHGEESFVFEIIDTVRYKEELGWREEYWFDKYDFDTELYNIAESSYAPMYGIRHSAETREKMSEANSGENNPNYGKPRSQETKDKISEALSGENHPMYGHKHSDEHKEYLTSLIRGENNPNWGKPMAEETKEKMRKQLEIAVNQVDPVTDEVICTFDSITKASKATGIGLGNIGAVCAKTPKRVGDKVYFQKTAGGYKWEYANELDK